MDCDRYQCRVGKLIYLCHTKLGITYEVSVVSQLMPYLKEVHLEAINRILRYLKFTLGKEIIYEKK